MGWIITCECGEKGTTEHFAMSLADECKCPTCGVEFTLQWDEINDEDDE